MAQTTNFQFKNKSLIFPIVVGLILLIIVFAIAFLSFEQANEPKTTNVNNSNPSIENVVSEAITVEKIIPSAPLPLKPGFPYSFTVYFKQPVSEQQILFTLSYVGLYDDKPATPINISVDRQNEKTYIIKTLDPIHQYGEYKLSVLKRVTAEEIFTKSYLTTDVIATPVPSNNPVLKPFLPHETPSYILEYFPDRNIYIFHFKYNPNLPTTAEVQFNTAQQEATNYIQSKGIPISSIIIEWKNY